MKLSERDFGWLEGIIDGEGSLGLSKVANLKQHRKFYWRPILQVGSTDRSIAENIARILGLGSIHTRTTRTVGGKLVYQFQAQGARSCLKALSNLHFVAKERHRELLIEACHLISQHTSWGRTFNDGRIEEIYEEMKRLNIARGKRHERG